MNRISPVDLLVSGFVAILSTWWWHQFRLGGLLFGVLAAVVLLWRRRYPFRVLAAVSVLTVGTATIEVNETKLHDGMLLLTLAVAMHAVIAYAPTLRRAIAGGVAAWLVSTLIMPLQNNYGTRWSELSAGSLTAGLGALLGYGGLVWAAGLTERYIDQLKISAGERRRSAERERQQVTQIAVAEERTRIARELHDIVAHSLSVIILQANGAAYAFDHDQQRARDALRTIGATGADALDEIRQLVDLLRGDGDSAPDRIPAALDQIEAVVQRARDAGLMAELTVHGPPPEVPAGVALAVCRIVQESLTNTLKHAGTDAVAQVTISYRPAVIDIEVTDTGTGTAAVLSGGHGLAGMRERIALYGGTFEAGPRPTGGWRVHAGIPLAGVRAVPA